MQQINEIKSITTRRKRDVELDIREYKNNP